MDRPTISHNGWHIYTHDRHAVVCFPFQQSEATLASHNIAGSGSEGSIVWSRSELLNANLRDRDNLSTKDKRSVPNVSRGSTVYPSLPNFH